MARGEGEVGGEWGKETIKNISMTSNRSGGFKTGFDQEAVSWLAFSPVGVFDYFGAFQMTA